MIILNSPLRLIHSISVYHNFKKDMATCDKGIQSVESKYPIKHKN
jgi:hypothetical protein